MSNKNDNILKNNGRYILRNMLVNKMIIYLNLRPNRHRKLMLCIYWKFNQFACSKKERTTRR